MVDQFEGGDFGSCLLNRLAYGVICLLSAGSITDAEGAMALTKPVFHVHRGRSALQDAKGADDWRGHSILRLVYPKVLERPLGLSAPVVARRHLDLAKGIGLGSGCGRHG